MSSILKAIRKVEEEKRAAAHTAPDLRSDQGGRSHTKKSLGPLLTGMILGAVCVGLFLYATSEQDEAAPVMVKAPVENVAISSPEPAPVKPVIETIPVVTLPPEPVPVKISTPAVKKTVANPEKKVARKTIQKQPATPPPVSKKPTPTPDLAKPPALPDNVTLKVAEIFYQEDPANRMAVVNDLPVMVGTPVDGALVQEIQPEHVVFRINGTDYTVAPSAN